MSNAIESILDSPQKYLEPFQKILGEDSFSGFPAGVESLRDLTTTDPVEHRIIDTFATYLYTSLNNGSFNQVSAINSLNKALEEKSFNGSPITVGYEIEGELGLHLTPDITTEQRLSTLQIHDYSIDAYSFPEVSFKPSSSYKLSLQNIRDLLTDKESFLVLSDILGVHENFKGIKLDPTNYEPMILYAVEVAAKLLKPSIAYCSFDRYGKKIINDQVSEDVLSSIVESNSRGEVYCKEGVSKTSNVGNEYFYIPRHRVKPINSVTNQPYPINNDDQSATNSIVERRSDIILSPNKFLGIAKEFATTYWGMYAIAEKQKSKSNHDFGSSLTQSWDSMVESWFDLLSENDLEFPNPTSFMVQVSEYEQLSSPFKFENNSYNFFIDKLVVLANRNPEFAMRSYGLLSKLRNASKLKFKSETIRSAS